MLEHVDQNIKDKVFVSFEVSFVISVIVFPYIYIIHMQCYTHRYNNLL